MIVTDIIPISSKQCKIMIDEEFAFVLYKGELHLYSIKLQEEIKDEVYEHITKEVLPKRAKLRAMNLLMKKSYTEQKLRDKLLQGQYKKEIVDEAIEYCKSFGYVNDEQYVRDFIFYKNGSLNKRQIFQKLREKGVKEDLIERIYEEAQEQGNLTTPEELIYKQLKKKHYDLEEEHSLEEKNKIIRYLLQKGFPYDVINSLINHNNV